MPKHATIDSEQLVADLKALRLYLRLRIRRFPYLLQLCEGSAVQHVHRHIAAPAERWRELLQDQEDLAIIGAWIVPRLNVNRPGLTGIRAAIQVASGYDMRVIKAQAGRFRYECDPPRAVRRHKRRAFLGCAVHIAGDHLSVPVDEFRCIRVVMDINNDPLPLLESQQWSGELAAVERGRNDVFGRQFDETRSDAQGVIGFPVSSFGCVLRERRYRIHQGRETGTFQ